MKESGDCLLVLWFIQLFFFTRTLMRNVITIVIITASVRLPSIFAGNNEWPLPPENTHQR